MLVEPQGAFGVIKEGDRPVEHVGPEDFPSIEPYHRAVRSVEAEVEIGVVHRRWHHEVVAKIGGDVFVRGEWAVIDGRGYPRDVVTQSGRSLRPSRVIITRLNPVG